MNIIEEADIEISDIYRIRPNYNGIMPELDNLDPKQVILAKSSSSSKLQGGCLNLDNEDPISTCTFRDLWREKAAAGLPLLVCRVTTTTLDKNTVFKHFFSLDILKWFYGQYFPESIESGGNLNPINQLEPEGEIDIYLAKLGTTTTIPYIRLGSDLHMIRKTKAGTRIANILKLTTPEKQSDFSEAAEKLQYDIDPYVQSTALTHNALYWLNRGKKEKSASDIMKGMHKLSKAINIVDGNPYARVHGIYEYTKILNMLDMLAIESAWLTTSLQTDKALLQSALTKNLKILITQSENLLIRDRALTLLTCIKNSIDLETLTLQEITKLKDETERALEIVYTSNKSPKKSAFAALQLGLNHSLTDESRNHYWNRATSSGNNAISRQAQLLLDNGNNDNEDLETATSSSVIDFSVARRLLFDK